MDIIRMDLEILEKLLIKGDGFIVLSQPGILPPEMIQKVWMIRSKEDLSLEELDIPLIRSFAILLPVEISGVQ